MKYDNTNKGALWINKKEGETQPDCNGSANIDGVEYFVSMWGKKNPEGNQPRFTLSFKMKDEQPNITPAGRANGLQSMKEAMGAIGGKDYEPGEDIPF